MSKAVLYALLIGVTYATLDKGIFKAGVGYTEDQLGKYKDDEDGEGNPYFGEVEDDEVEVADISGEAKITSPAKAATKTKTLAFGKKGKAEPEGGNEGGAPAGNDGQNTGNEGGAPEGKEGNEGQNTGTITV